MTQQEQMTFETAYARLEEILEKMNSGKITLEDSLKLYEEADKLISWSNKRLTEAEKKIEILMKNRSGNACIKSSKQDPAGIAGVIATRLGSFWAM